MPLHAVVSFELRWQFINDSSLGWAPLEVLTILTFTPNHFGWPFPPNSSGVLSLSQAFRICMALLRTSKNYVSNSLQKEQRTRNERRNKQTWGKARKTYTSLTQGTYCNLIVLWLPKWYEQMFYEKKHGSQEGWFLPPTEASQWLHSRTAAWWCQMAKRGESQRSHRGKSSSWCCFWGSGQAANYTSYRRVVWLRKQNSVFCENIFST